MKLPAGVGKLLAVLLAISAVAAAQDLWTPESLIKPQQAAKEIHNSSDKPVVLFVGFPVMYRAAHIPDAVMAGPASTPDGLAKLKAAAAPLSRSQTVILYCGCCPLVKCPNVRPAYKALTAMGFTHVQVIELDQNFHTDWEEKGLPVKKPS